MIEQYWYMNMKERRDKHHAQQAVCAMRGVPYSILERYPAGIENEVCPESIRELARLIVDDGFEAWSFYADTENIEDKGYRSHWLASDWTKLRALRDIANSDKVTLLSSDAWFLKISFDDLCLSLIHI